jgi:7-keto-8-aminopelargonate synthetase-like enzyme
MGPELEFVGDTEVLYQGQRYTFFGGNDYHRFSRHPEVLAALTEAAQRYGINSAGSRLTTANHPLYLQLEAKVAEFLGAEAAAIVSAGYLSAIVAAQAVAAEFDLLFLDDTAHACLVDAAMQSGKEIVRFQHRDPADLLEEFDGSLLIDDAHSVGVLGRTGKGTWEEAGMTRRAILQTGTLSKGLGGFGGFIAGSREVIAGVRTVSRAFTGSTPMPFPIAAASLRAIEILQAQPEKIALLRERSARWKPALRALGFPVSEGLAPICSVTFFDAEKNRALGDRLRAHRIFPSFIHYPGSPPGGHYRFTLSSAHSDADIENLYAAIREMMG